MKKVLKDQIMAGSANNNEPRLVGEVLNEYLGSNEPLSVAYRDHTRRAAKKGAAAQTDEKTFPNTELGVDLKLITRTPGRIPLGTYLDGVITHDGEYHFTFLQNALMKERKARTRNPHVYNGAYINVSRNDDGGLRPNFNRPRLTEDFDFSKFCLMAAEELIMVAGLVEEEGALSDPTPRR